MADETGGGESGDDLFEDLDKFFAPIHDVDWPEEEEGKAPEPAAPRPTTPAAPAPPHGDPGIEPPSRAPSEPDDGIDLELPPPEEDEAEPEGGPVPPDVTGGPPAEEPRFLGQPTESMAGEDWDDLRSRFGTEDVDVDQEPPGEEAPSESGVRPYSFMERFLPRRRPGAAEPGAESPDPGSRRSEPPEPGEPEALEEAAPGKPPEPQMEPAGPPGAAAPAISPIEPIEAGEPAADVPPLAEGARPEPDAPQAPAAFEPPPAEEPARPAPRPTFGSLEPADELSVEDLRKAPEEYRDLPAPLEVEPLDAGREPATRVGGHTGAGAGAVDEPPPPGGLEAAAEHFADAMRQSGEVPVIGQEPREEPVGAAVFDDVMAGHEEDIPPPPRTVKVGVTETLGPSWQEPTSEEVVSDAEPRFSGGGRNLPAALLTGLVLAAIGVGSVAISKAAFTVVAIVVVAIAQLEMYTALRRQHHQPAVALGLVLGVMTMAAAYLKGEGALLALAAMSVAFTFLWYMAVPARQRRNVLVNVAFTLLPYFYVPFLAGYVVMLVAASRALMLMVVGLAVGYDIAAFAFGSLWGSRPLAPSISPKKTWEGAIAATLVVVLVSVAALASVHPITKVTQAAGLAIIVAIFAPLGDLAESLMKRDLGIKDMGGILPGHGGLLDRVDSILLVAPAAFYFVRIVLFHGGL